MGMRLSIDVMKTETPIIRKISTPVIRCSETPQNSGFSPGAAEAKSLKIVRLGFREVVPYLCFKLFT